MHGLNYMRLKLVDGPLVERAKKQLKFLYPTLLLGEVAFAITLYFNTDFFTKKPIITLILLVVIVGLTLLAWYTNGTITNSLHSLLWDLQSSRLLYYYLQDYILA
ncbi:Uncharacterised protein [Weissella viridescens]|uniref:Uncharacterized protein n=1 Tax=Weissella viridescens TaxID=1629 RepID=A0A380P8Z6_WEIVI|nr:Uncharacterised protein [Weissella viridescens]